MPRHRQHLPVPALPQPAKLVEQRRLFASKVAALAWIVSEVEQKFPFCHFQVFPFATAHRPLLAIAHAPIERALARQSLSGQNRQQIAAVELITGWRRDTGCSETGRGQIHCDRYLIGDCPSLYLARPPADLRHSEPAFQQVEFAADKGPDLREALAAIVAGENDESFAPGGPAPHCLNNPSDASVQDLHHFAVNTCRAALGDLRPLELALPRRCLNRGRRPWPMRRGVMEAEKIRSRRVRHRFDKGDRPLAQQVGDIALPLDRYLAFVEVVLAAVPKVSVITGIPKNSSYPLFRGL